MIGIKENIDQAKSFSDLDKSIENRAEQRTYRFFLNTPEPDEYDFSEDGVNSYFDAAIKKLVEVGAIYKLERIWASNYVIQV